MYRAVSVLTGLFPVGAFYGQGSPTTVITDNLAAEKDGPQEYGLTPIYSWVYFISCKVCGDGYSILIIKYIKTIGNF